jgi:RraA family protein
MSNIGFRIYTEVSRPERTLIEGFRGIPVANIADNMGRISCMDSGMKPFNEVPLLGPAFTVHAAAGDNLMFHKALDMAEKGDIIVVNGEGNMDHSLCGEIIFRYAIKRGIGGIVVDGCIRDAYSLKKLNLPVYARGVNPKGPYKNGPGEINVTVCCGGQVVFPGDIICGDEDGIVVIRPHDAKELLEKAIQHNKKEVIAFKEIEAGTFDRSWVDKALTEKGCEIIDGKFPV